MKRQRGRVPPENLEEMIAKNQAENGHLPGDPPELEALPVVTPEDREQYERSKNDNDSSSSS
jgi:hypothetical protein